MNAWPGSPTDAPHAPEPAETPRCADCGAAAAYARPDGAYVCEIGSRALARSTLRSLAPDRRRRPRRRKEEETETR
jgi:hypothetical protein